jgi:predicted HTH domain antitoxin
VTIELPDIEAVGKLSPSELRLELACALYERGRITKVSGAELAGVDLFQFQQALGERGIASITNEMFETDVATLKSLFQR